MTVLEFGILEEKRRQHCCQSLTWGFLFFIGSLPFAICKDPLIKLYWTIACANITLLIVKKVKLLVRRMTIVVLFFNKIFYCRIGWGAFILYWHLFDWLVCSRVIYDTKMHVVKWIPLVGKAIVWKSNFQIRRLILRIKGFSM